MKYLKILSTIIAVLLIANIGYSIYLNKHLIERINKIERSVSSTEAVDLSDVESKLSDIDDNLEEIKSDVSDVDSKVSTVEYRISSIRNGY
jgi:peptidoglycan hydrolase CwlO-like protein